MPNAAADLKALHATALAQFKFIAETEAKQRESELEALQFEAGDQWPPEAKASRAGSPANTSVGTPAVPARPMLTMRTLDQPLAQIDGMARDADMGMKIVPKDGKANKATAEVIAGLARSIQTDSYASFAYDWGFKRMRGCGRGYWRVNKAYANEQGGFDQVVRIEPIENGFSVYRDPLPKWQPTGGFWEPEFTFVTEDLHAEAYKRSYGKTKLATGAESQELTALGDDAKHWTWQAKDSKGEATGERYYRVAEYWYAVYDVTTETHPTEPTQTREIRTRRIMWAKMNGCEFIEAPQEWDGAYIPIILDSGNKFNIGGAVIWEGIVQPNMSPCRMLNYMTSAAAEKIGLGSLAPWIGVAGQFQGFEAWWDQANTRNFSKLEYNAVTDATGQQILGPPTRNNDEPAIQAFAEMIGLFTNFIRSTTGVSDAALGHVNPNDKSGKAIEALKNASRLGTSMWLAYHANAIRHTGVVVVDLIPRVYDSPERVERILGIDGKPSMVMLNAPFTRDADGTPVPQKTPGVFGKAVNAVKGAIGMAGAAAEHYDLSQGQYAVIVNVGKSEDTQRDESMVGMSALAQAAPELVPKYADLWVRTMPIKEADAIADRLKPAGVDDPNLPPQAQALLAQKDAQIQELSALADDNQTKVTIAAAKDATTAKVAEIKSLSDLERNERDNETKLAVAALGAKVDRMLLFLEERARLGVQSHELGMAAMAHEHEKELAQIGHEQGLEAASMPPPIDPNRQIDTGGA